MKVNIAWGIRSAVCSNEFLDDFISYVSLLFIFQSIGLVSRHVFLQMSFCMVHLSAVFIYSVISAFFIVVDWAC